MGVVYKAEDLSARSQPVMTRICAIFLPVCRVEHGGVNFHPGQTEFVQEARGVYLGQRFEKARALASSRGCRILP
jgi:hypothetical protein